MVAGPDEPLPQARLSRKPAQGAIRVGGRGCLRGRYERYGDPAGGRGLHDARRRMRLRGLSVSLRDIEGGSMIGEERILGKFSCEGCRRPSVGFESLLVAKTHAHPMGNPPWDTLCE